jgi:hypothetical protein
MNVYLQNRNEKKGNEASEKRGAADLNLTRSLN